MSFSSQVKEELSKMNNLANKEEVKAEYWGYLLSNNITKTERNIQYVTENEYNINRFHKLLTNLNRNYTIEFQGKNYTICVPTKETKMETEEMSQILKEQLGKEERIDKAIVRGTFLGGGSLNDPNRTYHLEVVFALQKEAQQIQEVLKRYSISCKGLERKKGYSLYLKEAEEISKYLAFIGANKAVLQFEEIRVVRETRNQVNRLVNCETANLNKTVNAAVEQIRAIEYLKKEHKFEELADPLKEIAKIRIENPEANLVELGTLLKVPIGKSGVNHRLKKICEIAQEVKKGKKQ